MCLVYEEGAKIAVLRRMGQSVDVLAASMVYGNMLGEPIQIDEESEESEESEDDEDK